MIRTPDQRLRVFVSSTLQELAAERVATQEAISHLRLAPVMFELGARPHPPRDLYRAYLDQSHVFVGVYWERYGWVAPDMDISGLEDEWRGAANLPKLVYIKEPAPDRDPRLAALLDEIRDDNSTSYRRFSSPDELRDLLENDLAIMLSERFEAFAAPEPPTPKPTIRSSLPRPPSALIGREIEVDTVRELLVRPDTRMVTITGPGGSGKTRLALEVAEGFCTDWRVCFVDLTGLRVPQLVMPTIAGTLGVRDAGERTLTEAIASVIDDQAVLLLIDNFEHVMAAAAGLGELLAATQRVKVLVTSRQPLHLRWEHEYPLLPLPVPSEDLVGALAIATSPAVDLLVERAQRARPTFQLTNDNAAAIAEITRRLDGLPLALELAAARLRVLSPTDLLARIEHRLDALAGASPDMPERHQTLRAAISWSHDLLTPDERVFLRRLTVFAGGAGLEAIEAVCAADDIDATRVLDIVASLVDKSLLMSAGDLGQSETRFYLLATVREFAAEQLLDAGEVESTYDRHLEWYGAFGRQAWSRVWSADMAAWLDILEVEHDNVRIALAHALGAGDVDQGLALAAALWPFWDIRGYYREGERHLRRLLERASNTQSATYGRALNARGWLVALLGDFEQAMTLMDVGVPLVRTHGDPHQLAWSLGEQGNVAFSLGQTEVADRFFTEAVALARELDDVYLLAFGLFGLGYVGLLRGDLDTMKSRLVESLGLTRRLAQPWGTAWAEFSLGVVAIMTGDSAGAVVHITESLDQRWSIRDARGVAESLEVLATLAAGHDDLEWAAYLHGAAEVQREANGLTVLPFLRPMHDESVARLRATLDAQTLDRRWQEGRSAPLEKAVFEAVGRDSIGPDGEPQSSRG